MFKTIKRLLGYFRPIIPNNKLNIDNEPIITNALNHQLVKLKRNELKSKELVYKYLKRKYQKDGLLPTEKQLLKETEHVWIQYKDSKLVDKFYNFTPSIKEELVNI